MTRPGLVIGASADAVVVRIADPEAAAAVLVASLAYYPMVRLLIGHTPGGVDQERYCTAWIEHARGVLRQAADRRATLGNDSSIQQITLRTLGCSKHRLGSKRRVDHPAPQNPIGLLRAVIAWLDADQPDPDHDAATRIRHIVDAVVQAARPNRSQ